MNQHDQMRELLKEARKIIRASSSRHLAKDWDVRATQALAAEPAPLVRLTDDSLISIYLACKAEWKATNKRERERIAVLFGHAIMDAMERINKK